MLDISIIKLSLEEIDKFAKGCTDKEAAQIEDKIREILIQLIPKSNRYIGVKEGLEMLIDGVNETEIVSNKNGGKQSKLDYRFDLIDTKAIFELAKVLDEGAKRYGDNNWRKIHTESHINHAISHLYAYLAGDTQDEHLSHSFCRVMMAIGVEETK